MAEIMILSEISTAQVVIIGLSLVFMLLVIITGILYLLPHVIGLFTHKKNKQAAAPSPVIENTAIKQEDDGELIAVMAAAIAQAEADSAACGRKSKFRVVSFKRVGKH